MSKILVTGAAGFIGFHVCKRLLLEGHQVIGFDNCSYPSEHLKRQIERLKFLESREGFYFVKGHVYDANKLREVFDIFKPDIVIHLAAKAGVRESLDDPSGTLLSNTVGFNLLAILANSYKVRNFIYASSSSVYGGSEPPLSENDFLTNEPKSFYAATKIANELDAHVLGSAYGFKSIGLRFFSVYGPYARHDSVFFKFAERIKQGKEIYLYNHGNNFRDFTYIDDVVDAIVLCLDKQYVNEVFNVGGGEYHAVSEIVPLLASYLGINTPCIVMEEAQAGDVIATRADLRNAGKFLGYTPKVSFVEGVERFMEWYIKSEGKR